MFSNEIKIKLIKPKLLVNCTVHTHKKTFNAAIHIHTELKSFCCRWKTKKKTNWICF